MPQKELIGPVSPPRPPFFIKKPNSHTHRPYPWTDDGHGWAQTDPPSVIRPEGMGGLTPRPFYSDVTHRHRFHSTG